ncbi:PmbA protein [Labrenzia sp. EL_13]|uniref:TldD/PmbA family protein n=1 Tax=Roseibium album TaxID=311410 RepID=UPI0018CAAFC1|nr:TldD/PmbA family protein [Roseibium album]MBG6154961.1 PmbA protein [Labrenzia sp. EL_162]MBG6162223.1 PmbA protein [Labrenzia sp. EL_195]MBG6192909.1 PmbA protein [Labrenzia sp. EL_159]MBG6199296.1 PmbA protein [Labrenzia sp. EL_13]MBG6206761.1 PmbA protein [Labrenzia sp. EL_126]MCR9058371.1 TldD/PmbA family protein [Paracoccaceae bacterium]
MSEMIDQSELQSRAVRLVEAARKAGADSCDAVAVTGVSLAVDVREGKVEETERAEGDDVTLRVFVGKRTAAVSANQLDDPGTLAERAVAMARVAPEDPYAGLADEHLLVKNMPGLELLDSREMTADALADIALEAETAGLEVAGVSKSGGAGASWRLAGVVLATSHGFEGSYMTSRYGMSMTAVAGEGTSMERDYDFDSRTYFEDLDAPAEIGRRAGERAVRRLNPQKLSTRTTNVIYESRAARSILGHLTGAINGASIARKTSFLKDRMGEAIFAPGIQIVDDPFKRRGGATRPFDGEGTAASVLHMIEDGILQHWFLDGASARELGLDPNGRAHRSGSGTSPGATNITLMPGELSLDTLMAEAGSGLLVSDLIGHGVNGITGDYSRGAAGFWFENGEIVEPVSEITIAGNLNDMFRRLVPGSDLDNRYSAATPSVMIEGMALAGS